MVGIGDIKNANTNDNSNIESAKIIGGLLKNKPGKMEQCKQCKKLYPITHMMDASLGRCCFNCYDSMSE